MIYAIDFGTTNSLLSAATHTGSIAPIALDQKANDPTIMKSVMYAEGQGQWQCGQDALDLYSDYFTEGRLLRSIKKYLPDPSFEGTEIFGKKYKIEDLIAVFLREVRQRANRYFDRDVTSVVLGRPALFHQDHKRHMLGENRLIKAARAAGFCDIVLCPEPIAASFGFREQLDRQKLTLVADFGGGTSDFTVLNLSPKKFNESDVLALGGISIAGDAFDGSIMQDYISEFLGTSLNYRLPMSTVDLGLPKHIIRKLYSPADLSFLGRSDILGLLKDAQKWSLDETSKRRIEQLFVLIEDRHGYKLFEEIERVKCDLSELTKSSFKFVAPNIEIETDIHSSDFRHTSHHLVEKITKSLDETLLRAGVKNHEIEIVCCTGGTAKIVGLQEALCRRFGKEKLHEHNRFHTVINGLAERARDLF